MTPMSCLPLQRRRGFRMHGGGVRIGCDELTLKHAPYLPASVATNTTEQIWSTTSRKLLSSEAKRHCAIMQSATFQFKPSNKYKYCM
jgi:hypothetical protein